MSLDASLELLRHLTTLTETGDELAAVRAGLVRLKFDQDEIEVNPGTVRAFLAGFFAAQQPIGAGLAFGAVRLADYLAEAEAATLEVPDTLEGLDP